ncbi:MAG: hypothetical protein JW891_18965 [Candidatus Lokiarchaeota archaeon]|nr:hypothetical protein [Candidatus Lokiarchaeota archaeon]
MQSLGIANVIKISSTRSLRTIKIVLNDLLQVPNKKLKPKIIFELLKYFKRKFSQDGFKIKVFIAFIDDEPSGFVTCQIDPYYRSYGRKSATFGWLIARDRLTCDELLKKCEQFAKKYKVRRIRGNINYPKGIGGIGIQIQGFSKQMLYGVPFGNPRSHLKNDLNILGYFPESIYSCMKVNANTWVSGKNIDKNFRFEYLTFNQLKDKKQEILELAEDSFYSILPDSSGGKERFDEIMTIQLKIKPFVRRVKDTIECEHCSENDLFKEAWETCNLKEISPLAPIAIDKNSGEIAGVLLGIPDMYQIWLENEFTRVNIDTAIIRRKYRGKGLFSALNNLGQLTCRIYGVNYFEGTSIWSNNSNAVKSIFPHCSTVRKHAVFQKTL